MNHTLDTVNRSARTFVQAAVGALVGINFTSGSVNWQEVLVTALAAGVLAVLMSFGITASQVNQLGAVVSTAKQIPAVAEVVAKAEQSPVVRTSEDVAREVAAQLTNPQR